MKTLLVCCLFLLVPLRPAAAAAAADEGPRVFVCGHSFHEYVGHPLALLAREAGHSGHREAGRLFLGGSTSLQIWNLPDEKNTAKQALTAGAVDVLTLSPHERIPDEGIDRFADLAFQNNPKVRVMVQVSWSPRMAGLPDPKAWRKPSADYLDVLRAQLRAINARHGRDFVSVVPVGPAVITLWERINAHDVPGVDAAGALFTDKILHPSPILKNLVAYCWFSAVYGESPVGLKALDGQVPAATNRVLQQIAWDAVRAEPLDGLLAVKSP